MAQAFVDISNVAMRYGGVEGTLALKGTSLAVAEGEFVAVVGPSGCGKSTLMRLVTGLWPPTEGQVFVDGQEVDGPLSIAGMAFQNPTLLPWRNILDNVMLPLEVVQPHRGQLRAKRADYERQARELLALVGLDGFEAKFPWQLSGGMQQRASLCRALIHQPRLLMLDEPFGALDIFTREDLWAVMQKLWLARRPTVILVTHDLDEATSLADRMLLLHRGRGLQTAPPAEMLARPASAEVARLLDLRKLFAGVILAHEDGLTRLRWGDQMLEAAPMASLPPGTAVDWLIGAGGVVLHRRGRPSAGERENPVSGTIIALLPMGEEMRVTLGVSDPEGRQLTFALPRHAAQRNALAVGEACSVSLLRDALHVMPRP
jgi:NitT/TauT family transport system ATP-binding protein